MVKNGGVKKAGLPPGSIVYVGKSKKDTVKIDIFNYSKTEFIHHVAKSVEECLPFKGKPGVTWINVDGVHQTYIIDELGRHFQLHDLVIEDIANTNQRPKIELHPHYLYMVLKMVYHNQRHARITEQISIILGENFVISFQENEGDTFDPIRQRIENPNSKIRTNGADFLAYTIIDSIIDHYFTVLEVVGDEIEVVDAGVLHNPSPAVLSSLHEIKREIIHLRKIVWPVRDVLSNLQRMETTLVKKSTRPYFGDIYDHTIRAIDTTETFRDMTAGLLDVYLSSVSNRMNEVMKVLTIIATIFIPLTFLTSVYGMNFEFMPELHWRYAYPMVWGITIAAGGFMFYYFKKKGWI